MNKYSLVILDNDMNFYGIMYVVCGYNEKAVHLLFNSKIKDMFKSSKEFYNNFSENLSNVMKEFEKDLVSRFGSEAYIEFEYNDSDIFNVDDIYGVNEEDSIIKELKEIGCKKEDLFVIAQCFADMIANNVDYKDDNIGESFYNWCEGGNIFYNMYGNWATEHLTENEKNEAQRRIKLMKVFCKYADNVTDFFLRVYNLL